jgi:hypothetical protein
MNKTTTKIRQIIKELGYKRNQVSVKTSEYGVANTSIRITIKDLSINAEALEAKINHLENIRVDCMGEFLEGCNTFIFVNYDYEALKNASAAKIGVCDMIIDEAKESESSVWIDDNWLLSWNKQVNAFCLFHKDHLNENSGLYRNKYIHNSYDLAKEFALKTAQNIW